jgi:hypothetical protein
MRTFNICTCGKESAFASDYCEDSLWMTVKFPKCSNDIAHKVSSKGVELLWAIELDQG